MAGKASLDSGQLLVGSMDLEAESGYKQSFREMYIGLRGISSPGVPRAAGAATISPSPPGLLSVFLDRVSL